MLIEDDYNRKYQEKEAVWNLIMNNPEAGITLDNTLQEAKQIIKKIKIKLCL